MGVVRRGIWLVLAVALVGAAPASARTIETVTRGADGHSYRPSISLSGRFVAFESNADSLSRADDDRVRNIYVRDMLRGRTILVSRSSSGAPADEGSSEASISAGGRFVAFQSRADNLGLGAIGGGSGIFVRDLRLGVTRAVSMGWSPAISGDGRYVAFTTDLPGAGAGAASGIRAVVRQDLRDGSRVLISRAPGHDGAPADSGSFSPAISADGNRVAFETFAENLDEFGEEGEIHKVFVRDVAAGTTERVSRGSGPEGRPGTGASLDPAISGDGRLVSFWSTTSDSFAPDERRGDHVWARELAADRIDLVDRAAGVGGEPGNGGAEITSLSHDGRFVAFESGAGNLAPGARRGRANVFVRDLRAHRTELISPGTSRTLGLWPAISGDGRYVVFERRSKSGVWHVARVRR